MKKCVICGRPIRTGWKYCFEHRNFRSRKLQGTQLIILGIIVFCLILFIYSLNSDEKNESYNNKINPQSEETEESILDICKSQFNTITETNYFEDYNSAVEFVRDKYPNEDLTINKAKFFEDNYLGNAKFPVFLIEGTLQISGSLTGTGLFVCDKNGLITN